MPGLHKDFIEFVEQSKPSIKDYILQKYNGNTDNELVTQYNACLSALSSFRSSHMQIVARYIIAHSGKPATSTDASGQQTTSDVKGTGGTTLVPFLKMARKDTEDARLSSNKPN